MKRILLAIGAALVAASVLMLGWPDAALTGATYVAVALVPLRLALADPNRLNGSTWRLEPRDDTSAVRHRRFYSAVARDSVSYLVYLPPGYDDPTAGPFPVIYWLYGSGGSPWDGAGTFVRHLAGLIDQGRVPPAIVVLPNLLNDSYFIDSRDGHWPSERVFLEDLVPFIDRTYRTIASREGRAIDGYSMGGFGAAHLGFKYPETFGVISVGAAPLGSWEALSRSPSGRTARTLMFGDNPEYVRANDPATLAREKADVLRSRTIVQLTYGERDTRLGPAMRTLDHELTTLGIPHRTVVVPGANHGTYFRAPDDRPFLFYHEAFASGR